MSLLVLCAAGGVLTWSLLEYCLHRFIGHLPGGRNAGTREHLAHHTEPTYFTPFARKLVVAVPVLGGLGVLAAPLAGLGASLGYVAGVIAGWCLYEWVHRRIHTHPPRSFYGRWARRHHLAHHFVAPKMNHGVTSPLWDIVLGTYQPVNSVRVPRKHARGLPWLLDGDGVAREYTRDYVIA